jgi:hypothetical protein
MVGFRVHLYPLNDLLEDVYIIDPEDIPLTFGLDLDTNKYNSISSFLRRYRHSPGIPTRSFDTRQHITPL